MPDTDTDVNTLELRVSYGTQFYIYGNLSLKQMFPASCAVETAMISGKLVVLLTPDRTGYTVYKDHADRDTTRLTMPDKVLEGTGLGRFGKTSPERVDPLAGGGLRLTMPKELTVPRVPRGNGQKSLQKAARAQTGPVPAVQPVPVVQPVPAVQPAPVIPAVQPAPQPDPVPQQPVQPVVQPAPPPEAPPAMPAPVAPAEAGISEEQFILALRTVNRMKEQVGEGLLLEVLPTGKLKALMEVGG